MAQRNFPPASPVAAAVSSALPGGIPQAAKIGDRAFERCEKTSAEFFAITYGALVRQMFVDHNENCDIVNAQLDAMGERIGVRIIEEYAARSGAPPCRSPAQAAEGIAKIGFKMFLGISANVADVSSASEANTFAVVFDENPLNLFVELPDAAKQHLWYSNILVGVLRGALGQVGLQTQVTYVKDTLRGDCDTNEIRVKFIGREKETFKVDMQK